MAPIVFDFYIGLSEHFMTKDQKEAFYIWKVKLKVGFPLPVLECMLICSWGRCRLPGSSEHAGDLGLDFQCFLLKGTCAPWRTADSRAGETHIPRSYPKS